MNFPDYEDCADDPDGTHYPVSIRELPEAQHVSVVLPYVFDILDGSDAGGVDLFDHLVRFPSAWFAVTLGNTS